MKMRTALVTGATTGIGLTIAQHLAQQGWQVYAGYRKAADAPILTEAGCQPIPLDVADEASIQAAHQQLTIALNGAPLHALVNNAGIAIAGPAEFIPLDEWRRQLEVNVTGQVAVTQAFLPLLRKGPGRIVFIGSVSGRLTSPMLGPYAASKHALEAVADAFRRELKPWDIHVTILQPGVIRTPIWEKSLNMAEELKQRLPEQAFTLYKPALDQITQRVEKQIKAQKGADPRRVARACHRALTMPRPWPRRTVGDDALMAKWLLKIVPTRWLDRMMQAR